MDDDPFCYRCDLPRYMCPHRTGSTAGRPAEEVAVRWERLADLAEQGEMQEAGRTRPALYGGRCAACGGRFEVDDPVRWLRDENRMAHEECAGV